MILFKILLKKINKIFSDNVKFMVIPAAVIFLLDFISKTLVLIKLPFSLSLFGYYKNLYPSYAMFTSPTSFFNLVLVWNNGVSFSMFSSTSIVNRIGLLTISILITIYVISLMKKETDKYYKICYSMIIGGALGNIFDRTRYGAVIDFLDFHIGKYHWPAFNVADTFISISVMVIFIRTIYLKKKVSKQ